jgi:carbonic anhydrase
MTDRSSDLARRSFLKLGGAAVAGAGLAGLHVLPAAAAGDTEAVLLTCMDFRLMDEIARYMEGRGLANRYDHLILAGASLGALTEKYPAWGQTFWAHLQLSRELHHVKRLIVIDHRDCGAYKALVGADLAKDPVAETKRHGEQLRRFRAEAQTRQPGLEVETLLMALDGSVEAVA